MDRNIAFRHGLLIQDELGKVHPGVFPVILLTQGDLPQSADRSVGIGHIQVDRYRIQSVVFCVIPFLFHIHGGGFRDPVLRIGDHNVGCLVFFVDPETVDGEAVGYGLLRSLDNRCAGGVQTVLIQSQLDHALGRIVATGIGRRHLLDVIGTGGTETPDISLAPLDGENIGGFVTVFIGLLAGPQVTGIGTGPIVIKCELRTVEDLLGQHILFFQGQGEPGRQVKVDGAVGHGAATLQIEDGQGMLAGFHTAELACALTVDTNLAGGEVDITLCRLVDTAQVQRHLAVDQDPDIIVTGELKVHLIAVDIPVAVLSVGQLFTRGVRQTELHIHPQTEPQVGMDLAGRASVGIVTGIVHIVGYTGVFSVFAGIVIGLNGLSVGIGIGRVEGKEVGILAFVIVVCRVRGSRQIIIDIESLVCLVVGCSVELCIVVIVTVELTGGICVDLEQVVTLTQIMLANDAFTGGGVKEVIRGKQSIAQRFIVDAGIDCCAAGVFVFVVQIVQVGDGAAAIVVIEGEIQGLLSFIGHLAASHMRPALTVAGSGHIHRDLR